MQYDTKRELWLLRLFILILPGIITYFLIYYFFQTNIFSFMPTWNDEIAYWHEIKSFAEVGFQSGFYSVGEVPAKANFTHFGPHGPMYTAFIGFFAGIFGWYPYSGAILNIASISCALLIYFYLTRPDYKQLILTGLVLLSFWPLYIFMPTNMQESIHHSFAIVLSGIFFKLIKNGSRNSLVFIISSFIFIIFSSLIRPTWSFLLIPFFLFQLTIINPPHILTALLKSLCCILIVFGITTWYSAPYPNFIGDILISFKNSFFDGLTLLFQHIVANLKLITSGTPLEKVQRTQVLIVFICCLILFFRHRKESQQSEGIKLAYFHIFNLGLILLFIILFYDMFSWRDYRLIAPNLLLSILLAIAFSRNLAPYLIIFSNLMVGLSFVTAYRNLLHDSFVHQSQTEVLKSIPYIKTQNHWNNTLLVDVENFNSGLTTLTAGIGISFFFSTNKIKYPIKSRYILVTSNNYKELRKKISLQQIGTIPNGILCLNKSS